MMLKTPGILMLTVLCVLVGFIVGGTWARRKEAGAKDSATSIAFLLIGVLAAANIVSVEIKQRDRWEIGLAKISQFERCDTEILTALRARDEFDQRRNEAIIGFLADRNKQVELLQALSVELPPLPACG